MKAVKANKEYSITEECKASYVSQGFDIMDEDGNLIEYGKGKTVDYTRYRELLAENERLMTENEKLKKKGETRKTSSQKAGE